MRNVTISAKKGMNIAYAEATLEECDGDGGGRVRG